MATTPNYGWVTPAPTDFVTDLPADFEVFADAVDADLAGLLGGTTGQVLAKDSNADHDFSWQQPIGNPPTLRPRSSGTYLSAIRSRGSTFGTATLNQTSYMPIFLPNCTLDRISMRSGDTFVSAGVTRLGIYNNNSATNLPDTVLLDAGTVNVTASNTNYEITISQAITEGWYWLAINRQGGDYNAHIVNSSGVLASYPINVPEATTLDGAVGNTPSVQGYIQTGVSGAFGTAGTLTRSLQPAICAVRIA